jgi:hypothetical protein
MVQHRGAGWALRQVCGWCDAAPRFGLHFQFAEPLRLVGEGVHEVVHERIARETQDGWRLQ